MIIRQLYQTCITAISDYDFEIWWNDQKSYAEKFQKLQNLKLRKILKIFKTSSIAVMKIEINIQSIKIRLNQKNQKLILQIMKLNQRHFIRLKTFWNYLSERIYESTEITETKSKSEFEIMKSIIEKNQFLNWNQFEKQSTQLIKILQSISKINIDFDCDLIENFNHMTASWQNSIQSIDVQIDSVEKNIIRKNHFQLTKRILNQKDTAVFYTDEAYDEKSKISAASVVLYQNFKILSKSWNLEIEMNIIDVKIYVIEKTIEWVNNLMQFSSNIWFFTDSQKSIKLIENLNYMLINQIHQNLIKNQINNVTLYIHWISEHANIPNNEKANQLIKLALNIDVIGPNQFLSFDFIKNQIIKFNQNE